MSEHWQFWIDRGGTFTDCIGIAPDGRFFTAKLLSSDRAPVEGIRQILKRGGDLTSDAEEVPCTVRLGTTVATNALLERRGVSTLIVTNQGLGDVLTIGTQQRPELFDLAIEKPIPLAEQVLELSGRVDVDGSRIEDIDHNCVLRGLKEARRDGIHSVAILQMHSYAYPESEERLAEVARSLGFPYVVCSSQVARELGLLARGETTVADAYLTPLLREHAQELSTSLPNAKLRFMQSSGGLTDFDRFRGPGALLSGPAGGVIGTAYVARQGGYDKAIGFDMGGTSTDVSLVVDGEVERSFETTVGGIRVRAPMLRIHTIAAGGGSLCRFDGIRLTVGPESAGAEPGPLCYGRLDSQGRLLARELALTDVNFWLGRVPADRLPFPLQREPVDEAFSELASALAKAGLDLTHDDIASGFVEIANANMAQAIQEVSVRRGVDPRSFALVGFGGAGGQHVCALARRLSIKTILLHPHAGLLSAFGIGVADVTWDRQRDAGRVGLDSSTGEVPATVCSLLDELECEGRTELSKEADVPPDAVMVERSLDVRYVGTETALAVVEPSGRDFASAFVAAHRARFGYTRENRGLEIVTARVRAHVANGGPSEPALEGRIPSRPLRFDRAWFPEAGWSEAPVYSREALACGQQILGPAIVLEDSATVVLDPGFVGRLDSRGILIVEDLSGATGKEAADLSWADPIRLEVVGSRFMSIAEQMGAVLRNTAVSTNIKERLDYSCAVFDRHAGLVANAPHMPVHLGAMGETVAAVDKAFPDLVPADVIVTNDPFQGGSHLPDVTVVAPVFWDGKLNFFVATRGHHADIGGITPGSMPADSRVLEEEGVLLRPFRLVRDGRIDETRVRRELLGARYPARNPEDNFADLEAMVAATHIGVKLLHEMVNELGREVVEVTMAQLQDAAGRMVGREIAKISDGVHHFEDRLDDGTPICVKLEVEGERMRIDFTGTGPVHPRNLNAPRAVTRAAVIYVLRSLVSERIPLNSGCLAPVDIIVPKNSIIDPPPGVAVAGGNVETSQRLVDTLLGAIGYVAASQGTMNSFSFGDSSFGYYETIGGGAGAGDGFDGASGVHTHMTNTRITDPEVLETRYPVVLEKFSIRKGSGGAGRYSGGDGLVRCFRFAVPVTVSLLTERRTYPPYGLFGGEAADVGRNTVIRANGDRQEIPGSVTLTLAAGDRLVLETPGGGGFGAP